MWFTQKRFWQWSARTQRRGKRLIQCARDEGRSIDATQGRRTKGIVIMDNGYVVLSALLPETIAGRFNGSENPDRAEKKEDGEDE